MSLHSALVHLQLEAGDSDEDINSSQDDEIFNSSDDYEVEQMEDKYMAKSRAIQRVVHKEILMFLVVQDCYHMYKHPLLGRTRQ